jgi:CRP/FNR family transcriptional regulator, cyclic AMP receptor protein
VGRVYLRARSFVSIAHLLDSLNQHDRARNAMIGRGREKTSSSTRAKSDSREHLLLARYREHAAPPRVLPRLSQETLAEMVGTTRSRVNFFMNKFRKLGLIEYNGGLKINAALLSVVLHE